MRGKRVRRLAAVLLSIGVVSGCGGAALVSSPVSSPASPAASAAADPTMSVAYCQQLANGEWVTNDSADSTTQCVPDPAYATGNEAADASVAVPRCFTCKLSDWERAEQRAAEQTGQASPASAVATATPATWSRDIRTSFISDCTVYMTGSLCQCLVDHLEWQVPADQAQALSGEDPRVQAAARDCKKA